MENTNEVNQAEDNTEDNTAVTTTESYSKSKFFLENGFERKAIFQTPDGQIFDTQAAASEHMRIYLVREALTRLVPTDLENGENLIQWLFENRVELREALDAAKRERKQSTLDDEARGKVTERLAAAREKGSLLALLNAPDTSDELKVGLKAKLEVVQARLDALSPTKKNTATTEAPDEGLRAAIIAAAG